MGMSKPIVLRKAYLLWPQWGKEFCQKNNIPYVSKFAEDRASFQVLTYNERDHESIMDTAKALWVDLYGANSMFNPRTPPFANGQEKYLKDKEKYSIYENSYFTSVKCEDVDEIVFFSKEREKVPAPTAHRLFPHGTEIDIILNLSISEYQGGKYIAKEIVAIGKQGKGIGGFSNTIDDNLKLAKLLMPEWVSNG